MLQQINRITRHPKKEKKKKIKSVINRESKDLQIQIIDTRQKLKIQKHPICFIYVNEIQRCSN